MFYCFLFHIFLCRYYIYQTLIKKFWSLYKRTRWRGFGIRVHSNDEIAIYFIIPFLFIPFAAFLCRYTMLDLIASALTLSKEHIRAIGFISLQKCPTKRKLLAMYFKILKYKPSRSHWFFFIF